MAEKAKCPFPTLFIFVILIFNIGRRRRRANTEFGRKRGKREIETSRSKQMRNLRVMCTMEREILQDGMGNVT